MDIGDPSDSTSPFLSTKLYSMYGSGLDDDTSFLNDSQSYGSDHELTSMVFTPQPGTSQTLQHHQPQQHHQFLQQQQQPVSGGSSGGGSPYYTTNGFHPGNVVAGHIMANHINVSYDDLQANHCKDTKPDQYLGFLNQQHHHQNINQQQQQQYMVGFFPPQSPQSPTMVTNNNNNNQTGLSSSTQSTPNSTSHLFYQSNTPSSPAASATSTHHFVNIPAANNMAPFGLASPTLASSLGDHHTNSPIPPIPSSLSAMSPGANTFLEVFAQSQQSPSIFSSGNVPPVSGSPRKQAKPRKKASKKNTSTENVLAAAAEGGSSSPNSLKSSKKSNSMPILKKQCTAFNSSSSLLSEISPASSSFVDRSENGLLPQVFNESTANPLASSTDTSDNSGLFNIEGVDSESTTTTTSTSTDQSTNNTSPSSSSLIKPTRSKKNVQIKASKDAQSPAPSPKLYSMSRPPHTLLTPVLSGLTLAQSPLFQSATAPSPSHLFSPLNQSTTSLLTAGMSKFDLQDSTDGLPPSRVRSPSPTSSSSSTSLSQSQSMASVLANPDFVKQLKETLVPNEDSRPSIEDSIKALLGVINSTLNDSTKKELSQSFAELSSDSTTFFRLPEYDTNVSAETFRKKLINFHAFKLLMLADPNNASIPLPPCTSVPPSPSLTSSSMTTPRYQPIQPYPMQQQQQQQQLNTSTTDISPPIGLSTSSGVMFSPHLHSPIPAPPQLHSISESLDIHMSPPVPTSFLDVDLEEGSHDHFLSGVDKSHLAFTYEHIGIGSGSGSMVPHTTLSSSHHHHQQHQIISPEHSNDSNQSTSPTSSMSSPLDDHQPISPKSSTMSPKRTIDAMYYNDHTTHQSLTNMYNTTNIDQHLQHW
ncbi:hypothetical protein SAMD00019534_095140 [Acytostelium subglobosum LB1]|uniref:hypothetical protein n=1 Tax=Acytostelium subglobosum LB1 TaxID=1410327 RepID=UPI000644FACF|nr:hypothetical protein SAMD00019534_095140 [Acytostelium subglobosum LB1]GAM26339.1 hypothetical protein SAMD00019534_095140 [Acytostelium subglobosum LB1]|eukprot:XP_012750893.1 hypothetical protein SAMD00019534_095140 [Acytostelium subglobosum LB1]